MVDDDQGGTSPPRPGRPIALVQREVVLVIVLAVVAAAAFAMTRSLAEWTARTASVAADDWHARGRALLDNGRAQEGIALLRRAASHDRLNAEYTLSLVHALSLPSQDEHARDEARRLLLQLREREPDRPEINLSLARLFAAAGRTDDALRYYNHATYGVGPDAPADDRHRIRVELARFLLDQGERARAVGELFALAPDVPHRAADRAELAALFLRAGEARSALAEFQAALLLAPDDWRAAVGAGESSLAVGAFLQAEQHFEVALQHGASGADVAGRLALARRVRAINPLAPGLVSATRVVRVREGLNWAAERLKACSSSPPPDIPIVAELLRTARQPIGVLRETDALVAGIGLIVRGVDDMAVRCEGRDPDEAAWRLVGLAPGAQGG
jgi:tetratricopeptide (TPR) repeat protein